MRSQDPLPRPFFRLCPKFFLHQTPRRRSLLALILIQRPCPEFPFRQSLTGPRLSLPSPSHHRRHHLFASRPVCLHPLLVPWHSHGLVYRSQRQQPRFPAPSSSLGSLLTALCHLPLSVIAPAKSSREVQGTGPLDSKDNDTRTRHCHGYCSRHPQSETIAPPPSPSRVKPTQSGNIVPFDCPSNKSRPPLLPIKPPLRTT